MKKILTIVSSDSGKLYEYAIDFESCCNVIRMMRDNLNQANKYKRPNYPSYGLEYVPLAYDNMLDDLGLVAALRWYELQPSAQIPNAKRDE